MPVNYLEITQQIKEIGGKAANYNRDLDDKKENLKLILDHYSSQNEFLQDLVGQVLEKNNKLRCAVPLDEPLTARLIAEKVEEPYAILAADGSQINPSRHDRIPFGVINTGAFLIKPGQNIAPREFIRSKLLSYEEVYTDEGLLSERNVGLMRDYYEREILAELAQSDDQKPLLALTDGPLELYHEQLETRTYREYLAGFIKALSTLQKKECIVAGYIDKPYSDLVVRLLELTLLKKEEYANVGKKRFFSGVTDRTLFDELLGPGERSAIFRIQSASSEKLKADLIPHFFYFKPQNPNPKTSVLARVEIPAWIANQPKQINLLQYALNEQCKQLGSKPYPYSLHRAHEIAVVHLHEKNELENRIISELQNKNIPIENGSQKQENKNLQYSRTRYSK